MNANKILKTYFGYASFRDGQEHIINSILNGKDVLAIMPTGGGKSICYQIPALMLNGVTFVISPLIALMQDQVKSLRDIGIPASFINSSLSSYEIGLVYQRIRNQLVKIVYVAPERLETQDFIDFSKNIEISMIAVDEAHCVSRWGQDFRPSYLNILKYIESLSQRPIVSCFTATATEEVKNDIIEILNLANPEVIVTGYDRENLYYKVEKVTCKQEKDVYIVNYLKNHPRDSGIIYCSTRDKVNKLTETLSKKKFLVTKYHAGMENSDRKINQDDFTSDKILVIVATNAFGMGIDKPNVRFVIHYDMPKNIEDYYQESGRAGRDGKQAECILLYSSNDYIGNFYLIKSNQNSTEITMKNITRLFKMERYGETYNCLRNFILRYFGEERSSPCNNCGNCDQIFIEYDKTEDAKLVIQCVKEVNNRFGSSFIVDILKGSQSSKIKSRNLNTCRSFGSLKNCSKKNILILINQMINDNYLNKTIKYFDKDKVYPIITLGDISKIDEGGHIFIKKVEKVKQKSNTSPIVNVLNNHSVSKLDNYLVCTEKLNDSSIINPIKSNDSIIKPVKSNNYKNKLDNYLKNPSESDLFDNLINFSNKFIKEIKKLQSLRKIQNITEYSPENQNAKMDSQSELEKSFLIHDKNKYSINNHIDEDDELTLANPSLMEKRKVIQSNNIDNLVTMKQELLKELTNLRFEMAKKEQVLPSDIISNKSLINMCMKQPESEYQFLNIIENDRYKFEKYSYYFLKVINKYKDRQENLINNISNNIDEYDELYFQENIKKQEDKGKSKDFSSEETNPIESDSYEEINTISRILEEEEIITIKDGDPSTSMSYSRQSDNINRILPFNGMNSNENSMTEDESISENQNSSLKSYEINYNNLNTSNSNISMENINTHEKINQSNKREGTQINETHNLSGEKEQSEKSNIIKKRRLDNVNNFHSFERELFKRLKILRSEIAQEENEKNPNNIFGDPTLIQLCKRLPKNDEEFLLISGVNYDKLKKFGYRFLEVIKEYNLNIQDETSSLVKDVENEIIPDISQLQDRIINEVNPVGFISNNNDGDDRYNNNNNNDDDDSDDDEAFNNLFPEKIIFNDNNNDRLNTNINNNNNYDNTNDEDDDNYDNELLNNLFTNVNSHNNENNNNNINHNYQNHSNVVTNNDYNNNDNTINNNIRIINITKENRINLLKQLKKLRDEIADKEAYAPKEIFSDKILLEICKNLPVNEKDLMTINDINYNIISKYGFQVIQLIKEFIGLNNNDNEMNINHYYQFDSSMLNINDRINYSPSREIEPTQLISSNMKIESEYDLYNCLMLLRKEISEEENIHPNAIFNDNSLNEMCKHLPSNEEEFLKIDGANSFKYEKYGKRFLNIIRKF